MASCRGRDSRPGANGPEPMGLSRPGLLIVACPDWIAAGHVACLLYPMRGAMKGPGPVSPWACCCWEWGLAIAYGVRGATLARGLPTALFCPCLHSCVIACAMPGIGFPQGPPYPPFWFSAVVYYPTPLTIFNSGVTGRYSWSLHLETGFRRVIVGLCGSGADHREAAHGGIPQRLGYMPPHRRPQHLGWPYQDW